MSESRDPEVGQYAGIVSTALPCTEKTHPTCKAIRPHNQPVSVPSQQLQPSHGGSIFGDSSGALFSMYSKIAEEEDNEMAERWQKDADGLLIFVSPRVGIHSSLCNPEHNRLVYSPLPLLRCFPCQSRI